MPGGQQLPGARGDQVADGPHSGQRGAAALVDLAGHYVLDLSWTVSGLIGAALYNVLASAVGGVEIEVADPLSGCTVVQLG